MISAHRRTTRDEGARLVLTIPLSNGSTHEDARRLAGMLGALLEGFADRARSTGVVLPFDPRDVLTRAG